VPCAGALIFDNAIWHTAYPHTGSEPRRYFILGYQSSRARVGDPSPHRPWGLAAGQAEEWREQGLLNPARETLLGMRDGAYVSAGDVGSGGAIWSSNDVTNDVRMQEPHEQEDGDSAAVPFQLPLANTPPPLEELRMRIEEARGAAADAGEFRTAAALDDLEFVLCPGPASQAAELEYAPTT
jgi:hypothetical protein